MNQSIAYDPAAAFEHAMREAGIHPVEPLIVDGALHRIRLEDDRRGSKSGWYCAHGDHPPTLIFGDWRNGETHKFSPVATLSLDAEDRAEINARIEEAKRERDAERARLAAEAAERAAAIWSDAEPAEADHPYLVRKQVQPHGARVHHDGRLIIPVRDLDSQLQGLQLIAGDGNKRFLSGTSKRGRCFVLGDIDGAEILVCAEGFATCATIREATGNPVICAFDAGNLRPVAESIRTACPDAEIVIGADSDESGVGQAKARDAAAAVGGRVVIPPEPGDWNDHAAAHGLDAVRAAFAAAPEAPEAPALQPPPGCDDPILVLKADRLTEAASAERFARRNGGDLKHHSGLGWLSWDGRRWERSTKRALELAQDELRGVAALVLDELRQLGPGVDAATAAAYYKHANAMQRANALDAVLKLAAALPAMNADGLELDAHPWALCCPNGTVDLRTGELGPHRREHMLTRLCPVEYNPRAECPGWLAHLDRVLDGDAALVDYLQWAVGYTLTGSTKWQCFFVLHGPGGTGKTTTINTIMDTLGPDYAVQLDPESILQQRHARHTAELAVLRGVRLAAVLETGEGRRVNEPLVKGLTGGDAISARFMYGNPFTFRPELKLWLGTNHRPRIADDSGGMFRRVRLLPFTVRVLEGREPDLPERLTAERPGILAWAVQGAVRAATAEPPLPDAVKAATAEYESESDPVSQFLEECATLDPHGEVSKRALYAAYLEWCGGRGMTQRAFSTKVSARGFDEYRSMRARMWLGIRLESEGA